MPDLISLALAIARNKRNTGLFSSNFQIQDEK